MGVMQHFSTTLENLRKEKGLTQKQLADELGVSRGTISFYEKAERTADIEFLVKVSDYFDVSVNYLLGKAQARSTNTSVDDICDYTGLSEETIEKLHSNVRLLKECSHDIMQEQILQKISIVNYFLTSKLFYEALNDVLYYDITMKNQLKTFYDVIDEIKMNDYDSVDVIYREPFYNDVRLYYFEATENLKKIVDSYTEETYQKWNKAKTTQSFISYSVSPYSGLQSPKGYEMSFDLSEDEKKELTPIIERFKKHEMSEADFLEWLDSHEKAKRGEANANNNQTE